MAVATGRGVRRQVVPQQTTYFIVSRELFPVLVRVLAVLGLGVSSYLTYLHYSEASAVFCTQGSGCDIARSSGYSTVLGIPVALLGLVGFALVLGVSLSRLTPFRKGLSLFLVALAGVTFSAYLTYLEIVVIHAICPYCVLSASLMAAILLVLLLQRPLVPGLSAGSLRLYSVLVVVVVVLGSLGAYSGTDEGTVTSTPYQVALAKHLRDEGAVMYGAFWCPHCADQKRLFGDAFEYVSYVECDARGEDANPALCEFKGIAGYPTWEIGEQLYEGAIPLGELARLSGYSG